MMRLIALCFILLAPTITSGTETTTITNADGTTTTMVAKTASTQETEAVPLMVAQHSTGRVYRAKKESFC